MTSRAEKALVAQRRAKLVQYRLEGRPYADFYEELGFSSPTAASRDFSRALEQSIAEQRTSVEVYRETELLRLDGLWTALQDKVKRGEPRAIEVALQIIGRRAKLLGLDAPQKLEVLTIDAIDAQIAILREQLAAFDGEAAEAAGAEDTSG